MRILLGAATGILIALTPASALAQEPAHTEAVVAGPYTLKVTFANYPPFVDRDLRFSVSVAQTSGFPSSVILTTRALPGQSTVSTEAKVRIDGASPGSDFQGRVMFPVRGSWGLRFTLAGDEGSAMANLPLLVGAAGAIPGWMGWLVGLMPLLGVAGFGIWQAREVGRLRR